MSKVNVFTQIKGKLIVSCQALAEEPLHSPFIMGRMAYAAKLGGAFGIRANSIEDITEIKKTVDLPIIGIIKRDFNDSSVRITPTLTEIDELVKAGVEIIATDATNRTRHNGVTLDDFFKEVRKKYPDQIFMADCSTYETAVHAQELGFDCVGPTLRGYTNDTKGISIPDFDLLKKLVAELGIPIIAEGGIQSPAQLKAAFDCGVHAAVVGTAITRPMEITKHFANAIKLTT